MAAAGVRDILLTYPLVGARKAARFAALASTIRMAAVGDSDVVAQGLSAALAEAGATAAFLVECDTGYGRTGVPTPGAAAELGALADSLPGLRFAGFMTFPRCRSRRVAARGRRPGAGARPGAMWISGGGTPVARWRALAPPITEVRAGTYVYGDRMCVPTAAWPVPTARCMCAPPS